MSAQKQPHQHSFHQTEGSKGQGAVWRACLCGLRERLRYTPTGEVYEVRVQLRNGFDWLDPVELLRSPDLPYRICTSCGGEGCPSCGALGVTTQGERVR